ncbi:hypothetical protein C8R44DRAFT_981771 [Mycena epipterygia]|nr:hypothetical protein C8R44DRAFT_981771 [Mycena epipterygia]
MAENAYLNSTAMHYVEIEAEGELMVTVAAAGRAAEDEEDEEDTRLDDGAVEILDEDEYVG